MASVGRFVEISLFDSSGGALAGWKLEHYVTGTSTLKDVYTDRAKTTAAAQPVVADARGTMSFYADGLYKVVIKDANGSTLYTFDPVDWIPLDPTGEGVALASASTLILGTDGDFFHVTGSITINAISGTQPRVYLTFDGALTLTNSSNLILNGGVNATTAAGDTFLFINEGGGVWREVARSSSSVFLTTKGDLLTHNGTAQIRFAVGTTGQTLHADASQTTGLRWGANAGLLWGCTLANNGVDATNDLDIAVGEASSNDASYNDRVVMRLTSALTKQLDVAWAVGTNQGMLDTGSVANTTYHIFLIMRTDTNVVDVLASTSATSPTMPTNYTKKRRIGSIYRTGGANVVFTQNALDTDLFSLVTPVLSVDVNNPGDTAVLRTLSVPLGLKFMAIMNVEMDDGDADTINACYVSDPDVTDQAPSRTAAPLITLYGNVDTPYNAAPRFHCPVNTSAQVRTRYLNSAASSNFRIVTLGWRDTRGKEA